MTSGSAQFITSADLAFEYRKIAEQVETLAGWIASEVFGHAFSLQLLIVDNGILSARCAKLDKLSYAIYFGSGTFRQLLETFYRLLANPKIMPDIEIAGIKDYAPLLLLRLCAPARAEAEITEKFGFGDEEPPDDIGQDRLELVHRLTVYGAIWIFLHEVSHITTGDLDYRQHISATPSSLPLHHEFFAELYADMYAGNLGLHVVRHWLKIENLHRDAIGAKRIDINLALRLWGFSGASTQLLLQVGKEPAVYPPSEIRVIFEAYSARGFEDTHVRHSVQLEELSVMTRGFGEGVKAWQEMGWPTRCRTFDLDKTIQCLKDFQEQVHQHSPFRYK